MSKLCWDVNTYFKNLKKGVDKEYLIANKARAKGLDPVDKVEIPLAMTMAEKSVGLITTVYPDLPVQSITKRMLELEEKYGLKIKSSGERRLASICCTHKSLMRLLSAELFISNIL